MAKKLGAVVLFLITIRSGFGQDSRPYPAFDVASVKLSGPAYVNPTPESARSATKSCTYSDERMMCDQQLGNLILEAFNLKKWMLEGPEELFEKNEKFEVQAVAAPGTDRDTARLMLRRLLAERFGLRFHRERKDVPVYFLVQGPGGARRIEKIRDPDNVKLLQTPTGSNRGTVIFGFGRLQAALLSMDVLADNLTHQVGRPVIDRTGLDGYYSFTVEWEPDPATAANDEAMVAALQQELNLRLDKHVAPYELMIIDEIRPVPTQN